MPISKGDRMPDGNFTRMGDNGPGLISTEELFTGKRVLLFSVPGAFTPTCTARHLPGYVDNATAIKKKGVDTIACMAVNDVFVMTAWGKSMDAEGAVLMLADGNGTYAKALELASDSSAFGMGIRAQRFSILVDNGVVTELNIDPRGEFGQTSAETALKQLA